MTVVLITHPFGSSRSPVVHWLNKVVIAVSSIVHDQSHVVMINKMIFPVHE